MTDYSTSMRTDRCGDLRIDDTGRQVTLCGWVDRRREHGEHLAFVDLRDRSGIVQVVVDGAHDLRSEYVLQVTGDVRERPDETANDNLATGAVEVEATEVVVLATADPPHFPLNERTQVDITLLPTITGGPALDMIADDGTRLVSELDLVESDSAILRDERASGEDRHMLHQGFSPVPD